MYDLIIIGAGPAGITAGVYAARQKLNTLIITENIGGQAATSGTIENYTGFQIVSGLELAQIFEEHVKKYKLEIKEGNLVKKIAKLTDGFEVISSKGKYQAKTVILSPGKQSRKLGVPGEEEFRNKGVTYCAICDGPLFANKEVAIIGGGNSALDAAIQLFKIVKKVYIINFTDDLTGDPILIEKVQGDPKVEILNNTKVKEISGEKFVKGIAIDRNNKEEKIAVQGIFVEIGLIPNSDFGIKVKKNKYQEIMVDNRNRTDIPGLFAAGDVTDVPEKQIIVAAGDGAKACLSAVKYLNSLKAGKVDPLSKWRCLVCGYIYDPAQNSNVPFNKLPDNWVCPQCGAPKEQFEVIS